MLQPRRRRIFASSRADRSVGGRVAGFCGLVEETIVDVGVVTWGLPLIVDRKERELVMSVWPCTKSCNSMFQFFYYLTSSHGTFFDVIDSIVRDDLFNVTLCVCERRNI